MTDLISREKRLGKYLINLRAMKIIAFTWIVGITFIIGAGVVTMATHRAVSEVEFSNAHAFKVVK